MRGRTVLLDLAALLVVAAVALAVWAGQQRPADTYFESIKSRGVLRVGIDPTYAPFDTLHNGKVSGYDADLSTEIASALGVHVQFVPMALDTLYDGLAADKVDMLVSALPFVYERQKDVRYSEPYYQAGQVILVRAQDTSVASPADLSGKRVAVDLGSQADTEARRMSRTSVPGMHVLSDYHSPEEAIVAMQRGDAGAVITDNLSAEEYARSHPGAINLVLPPLTDEPYVIAMPVKAGQLAEAVNATIEGLRASGKLADMMSK